MKFVPEYMRMFVGGSFSLGQPRSVHELRETLRLMDEELKTWGEDSKIASIWLDRNKQEIQITLEGSVNLTEGEKS